MFISPCSETEVIQQIYSIKNSSSGYDEISSRFLVLAAEVLATPLKILFNFALKSDIIPVYKQGDKTDIGNYRHIYILLTFSEILKKLTYRKTHSFFRKTFNSIAHTIYGFRPAQFYHLCNA